MNYKLSGTPNSPVLIFSNSLGSEMMMWDELISYLLPYFQVLQYDTRGHGGSKENIGDKGYTIAELANDVVMLMDKLLIEKAYFCGLSMGGLIGQHLGIHHSDRFIKIVLSNTGAKIGNDERWNGRIDTISHNGMTAIVDDTIDRWFTDVFKLSNPSKIEVTKQMFLRSNTIGYCHCCCAVRDADFRESLSKFSVPALVITGDEDPVTDVAQAEFLVDKIPNAELKILHARHLSATELPIEFANILIAFFIGEARFDKGMHVRRIVLGADHVDRANAKINAFNGEFQSFITNYAWGEIWTRPGLSKHQRSLITLSMLIPLNRAAEFKMHIKAAFNNGVTIDEIKEVIMHSALYCGLPAANEAMHSAEEVFQSLNKIY